jgi:hypothetical protein
MWKKVDGTCGTGLPGVEPGLTRLLGLHTCHLRYFSYAGQDQLFPDMRGIASLPLASVAS